MREDSIRNDLNETIKHKNETKALIKSTKNQLKDYLININRLEGSDSSLIMVYKWFILKEQAIYEALNTMDEDKNLVIGLMWCPKKMKYILTDKLNEMRSRRNIDGPHIHITDDTGYVKPTYIETNDFTYPF